MSAVEGEEKILHDFNANHMDTDFRNNISMEELMHDDLISKTEKRK